MSRLATAEKLITEEPIITVPNPPVQELAVNAPTAITGQEGIDGLLSLLSSEGKNLLRTILQGGEVPPNNELLIEKINESALETMNDNLIDYAEGAPSVYDDYVDELQQKLGGK